MGVCFWLSAGKDLWLDELFTWYQVRDKTFAGLLDATATGFNLMPPGHFLLLWLLDAVGCLTPFSARLVSILAASGGLLVLARIWRTLWGDRVALILICILIGSSAPLLTLAVEVRPYALSFFVAAVALNCCLEFLKDRRGSALLVVNALCSFALPFLSYPAGIYSAALVLALGVAGFIQRRPPSLAAIGSYLAGWAMFCILSFNTLIRQIGHNTLGLRQEAPHVSELFALYAGLVSFPLALLLVVLLGTLTNASEPPAPGESPDRRAESTLLIPFILWLLAPPVFFALAKMKLVTIWGERFLLPTAVAVVTAAGVFFAAYIRERRNHAPWLPLAAGVAAICSLIITALPFQRANRDTPVRRFAASLPDEYRAAPVFMAEMNTFFHLLHYSPRISEIHLYAGMPANQLLLAQVSSRLKPVLFEDIVKLPRFVVLLGVERPRTGEMEKEWNARLRGLRSESGFSVQKIPFPPNEFIQEMWYVQRAGLMPGE